MRGALEYLTNIQIAKLQDFEVVTFTEKRQNMEIRNER